MVTSLAVLAGLGVLAARSTNMNGDYAIGNPNPNATKRFTADFATYNPGNKYFEVYSPLISTLYGQVFWTVMDPVPLPAEVVAQFKGKTMAITGYECDQVRTTPHGDVPLPITAAYNHHHGATIRGAHARLELRAPADPLNPAATHGHVDSSGRVLTTIDTRTADEAARGGPPSCVLHEGNGGEYRKSFHGYPVGFAQLVDSPEEFVLQPMQIDTWNRDNKDFDGFWPGPEPANAESYPGAAYSGLLECPCTDRITFDEPSSVAVKAAEASCPAGSAVTTAALCAEAAASIFPASFVKVGKTATGSNASMPPGCSVTLRRPGQASAGISHPSTATAYFNTRADTDAGCGAEDATLWGGVFRGDTDTVGAWVEVNATTAKLTIAGPAGVWFGLGLNASTMGGRPWAVVVDGHGGVAEYRLTDQGSANERLAPSITVSSNTVNGPTRVVVVTRPVAGLTAEHFSFDGLRAHAQIPVISAYGTGAAFAYHKFKASSIMSFGSVNQPACLCNTGASNLPFGKGKGSMVYTPVPGEPGSPTGTAPGAPKTTLGFAKNCQPYPFGTMLLEENPSCDIRSYTGGQSCCHHLYTLLDRNQSTPWQDQPLEYHHKWRIYYQEVDPVTNPIAGVIQYNWGGMATPTEYDVPQCSAGKFGCTRETTHSGVGWVHSMNGTWTVGDMVSNNAHGNSSAVTFLTIHGHCHAPACLSFELFNVETDELICSQIPTYGTSNATYDEKGYLAVPPCVFGDPKDGLMPPHTLPFGTKLFSKKRCSADHGHHGEMSLWQTYGVFA